MRVVVPLLVTTLTLSSEARAMSPPYPHESITHVEEGKSAPYVGAWALSMPAAEYGKPDTVYAACEKPVRIEAADDTHIFYLGPDEVEADAAIELIVGEGRTDWEPIAGGPSSFVVWVAEDAFNLYDADISSEEEWAQPLVYARCAKE